MADDLQGGICSGNWWNSSPRNIGLHGSGPLPCSTTIDDSGIFGGWSQEMVDMKTRSCEDQSVSVSDSSMVFQQKPQGSDSVSGGAGNNVLMDSNLQMMEFGISTPSMDWNQEIVLNRNSGRADNNFHSMLQDELSLRSNFPQESMMESSQLPKSWSPRNFSRDSSMAVSFKQINQGFSLDQNRLSSENSSDACTITCQGLPTSFSMESVPYGYQTAFLQGLYEPELQSQPPPYESRPTNYPFQPNYALNPNELSPSWQKFSQYQKSASPPKQLTSTNQLHFSNKAPFWNPSATSMTSAQTSFFPPAQKQFPAQSFEEKPNCSNYLIKTKPNEVRDSGSVAKKANSEPIPKRPRLETPSPLPTFKVRKEKLGDRVTALQQLVSPFGKTDTASVLFEAIDYIKFLHEQVTVLSAPYTKNGAPTQHQQSSDKSKDGEGPQKDLRSRGLCLVPMTSIFPVTNETSADFWTPTFGGTYR